MCGALKRLVVGIALLPALIRAGSGAEAAATRTISFSSSQPTKAVTVPANFVGFGCEYFLLRDWALMSLSMHGSLKLLQPASSPHSLHSRLFANLLTGDAAFLNSYDNEFSQNLLSSVADRMSAPPTFRVGGTSG